MVQAGGLRAVVLRRCRDTPGLVRDTQLVMVWVGRVPLSATAGADADAAVWRARAVQAAGLAAQVEHLTQTVATLSGLLFGDSSEKRNPGQQPGGGEGGHEGDGRARP